MAFNYTKTSLLLYFTLVLNFQGMAQLCFDATVRRGCAPLKIGIIECVGTNVDKSSLRYNYEYNFGDPIFGTTDTFYTYLNPGIYNIMQIGNVNGSGDTIVRSNYIEVLASPVPKYFVYVCDNNEVVIEITDTVYEEYFFDFKDGTPLQILDVSISTRISHQYATPGNKGFSIQGNFVPGSCGTLIDDSIITLAKIPEPIIGNFTTSLAPYLISFDYSSIDRVLYTVLQSQDGGSIFFDLQTQLPGIGTNSFQISNPGDSVNEQCFKVEARDECGNIISSKTFCGIGLKGNADNNRNQINWTLYNGPNLDSFEVLRNGSPFGYFSPNFPPSSYFDSLVDCGKNYCYRVKAIFDQGNFFSLSNEVCLKAFSTDTPSAVSNSLVSADLENTVISWDSGQATSEYSVLSFRSGNIGLAGKTKETEFLTDIQSNINLRTCYNIKYLDSCGNTSFVGPIQCPVILNVQTIPNFGHSLSWTDYLGWPNGVAYYEVQKTSLTGNIFFRQKLDSSTFSWQEQGIDTTFQDYYYRILAIKNAPDSIESLSNWELVEQSFKIFFPTAFTPNGDGLNDIFFGKGRFVSTYTLWVMNAWGEVIFETKDINSGWDGNFNGKESPMGTYIYKVSALDSKGNSFEESGTITLLR